MKLLVLGATGQIGNELVLRALAQGFAVRALVRTEVKLKAAHARLEVVVGSPTDAALVAHVVRGTEAVISTLGHTDLGVSSLVTDAARTTIEAMRASSVRRFMIISSTLVVPGGSFLTAIPRYLTRHALGDSAAMETVVGGSELDWTILRLSRLTNGAVSLYRLFENEPPGVTASVSRKTVAACILDRISDVETFGKALGVCATSR